MQRDKAQPFRARIYEVGINRCVDVPERVTRVLGRHKYVPVKGRVENVAMRSTLVPRGGGRHRLFIHSRIWRRLGVDSGDLVRISLLRDGESREVIVPQEIAAALPAGSAELAAFNGLTTAGRCRFVAWVLEAKQQETRKRRLQEGIRRIIENRKRNKRHR